MSRCVPCWDLDENSAPIGVAFPSAHSNSTTPDVPMLDFEVAELTWENGQLALHGLGPPRPPAKTLTSINPSKYTWEKPRASGTLESIVDQATCLPKAKASCDGEQLVTWIDHHRGLAAAATTVTLAMDAMVPCSNRSEDPSTHVIESVPMIGGTCMVGCSTRVGSCSGPVATQEEDILMMGKQARAPARDSVAPAWSGRDQSVSCSATFVRDSQHVSLDAYERDVVAGITSTSMASPENTSSAKPCTKTTTADDHDSVCHSRPQREAGDEEDQKKGTAKSSVSTKRSRAAAIHNQSERKRRDKINQRMKTLQKLVPNSSKTDKASMLDEVIDYLKQLQAQVQMMRNMSMPHMMLPMTMQQQLQMSMMAPAIGMGMGMPGMGMGMGVMDINSMNRAPNMTSVSPVIPNPFVPITSWDGAADRPQAAPATMVADPLSAFLAYQSQPMTMDAYSRMAAMYQQLQQPPTSSSKN